MTLDAAGQAPPPAAPRPDLPAAPGAADVVDAADAFLATLTEEQRAIAQIGLKPELAVRWTNFPGDNQRNGIFFHQMKPEQAEAALKVARAALGEEGFARFQEVRASDDACQGARPGGRRPWRPGAGRRHVEQSDANKDGNEPTSARFLRDRFERSTRQGRSSPRRQPRGSAGCGAGGQKKGGAAVAGPRSGRGIT